MCDRSGNACPSRTKAVRTRAAILAAAEHVFAEKGYAAARLADVAGEVGIHRASLLYHVRDKRDLYDTVLATIFAELDARYRQVLDAPAALPRRIEAIIETWVAFVAERPTVARLLLWEAADGPRERTAAATGPAAGVLATLVDAIAEGQRQGCFQPVDPIHFIVTILGATVFFVTATPRLAPAWGLDPLSPGQLAAHRAELLEIARRLLGSAAVADENGNDAAPETWSEAGAWI
jgi:AcrR family transcriptional regulator